LQLVRTGSYDPGEGAARILEELDRNERVIVVGDGFSLPWHVAATRRHVPHWFVLSGSSARPIVIDPFACRNELGQQEAIVQPVDPAALPTLVLAHPPDDTVVSLREAFALGDDRRPSDERRVQWFVGGESTAPAPEGRSGPDAIRCLALHFRDHSDEAAAYRQVDDIWSIARHRAFLAGIAADDAARSGTSVSEWVESHIEPLAKRWSHMAPLLLQAVLAIRAGREPTASVAETLDELAEREAAARDACPPEATGLVAP